MGRQHEDFSVARYLKRLGQVRASLDIEAIETGIGMIRDAWMNGRRIIVCGNGGSAMTASHYITDWNKSVFLSSGRPFKGICLNDNMGLITAYGNDLSYADVFVQQLGNHMEAEDLVMVVTGSGNSPNVVKVLEHAVGYGARTLAVCGYDGGKVKQLAEHSVWIPSFDMQICEDLHLVFGHLVMKSLSGAKLYT